MSKWIKEVLELIDFNAYIQLEIKLKEIDKLLREAAVSVQNEDLHDRIRKELEDGE